MATRKLNIIEMRDETANIGKEVENIENALKSLNEDVVAVFPQGWDSDNATLVLRKIQNMSEDLNKIKEATKVLNNRINVHIGNVETIDTVRG